VPVPTRAWIATVVGIGVLLAAGMFVHRVAKIAGLHGPLVTSVRWIGGSISFGVPLSVGQGSGIAGHRCRCLGGKACADRPWAGPLFMSGAALAVGAPIEICRRLPGRQRARPDRSHP